MKKFFYVIDREILIKSITLTRDESLPEDGYSFFVTDEGDVIGKYCNERAKSYLEEEINKQTSEGKIRKVFLKDYPCFPLRGAIEGFYGTPFTQKQRKDLFSYLRKIRMNAYIYAPKDDLYHRDRWREAYPAEDLSLLKDLKKEADKNYIDFYFAISPGKDFCYADDNDYGILLRKLSAIAACGIDKFALLMDDIQPVLSKEEAAIYASPAQAQATIANRLEEDLQKSAPLLFCPTDYMQNFDTPYREDLRKYLNRKTEVFWTGYNTVAEAITEEDGETVKRSFGREPILWDNYPVNDFSPKKRIYFGALCNRGRYLYKTHKGYVANLSSLYECNKIPLSTMADYAWDSEGYNAEESLKNAVSEYFSGCARAGKIFVRMNESNVFRKRYPVRELLEKGNFAALDALYESTEKALKILKKKAPTEFLEETKDLFACMEYEADLYFSLRGKRTINREEAVGKINACRFFAADNSFLKYAAQKADLNIQTEEERIIYRSWKK